QRLIGCLWTRNTDWLARTTEVGVAVAPAARGYGVAPGAIDVLALALLLAHRFQRAELRVPPCNVAARPVSEQAGFTYEARLRHPGRVHSGRIDLELWSMVTADLR